MEFLAYCLPITNDKPLERSANSKAYRRDTLSQSKCTPTFAGTPPNEGGTMRTTLPLHRHSVVCWPVISSGNLIRKSNKEPTQRVKSVCSSVPSSEISSDSPIPLGPEDPHTPKRRGICKLRRQLRRRSKTLPLWFNLLSL